VFEIYVVSAGFSPSPAHSCASDARRSGQRGEGLKTQHAPEDFAHDLVATAADGA
jgi:hypothetical protein